MNYTKNYIKSIESGCKSVECRSLKNLCDSNVFFDDLVEATKTIKTKGGRIFFVGNGASAAFCNHMALDWSKNGEVLASSLSDSALLTALANDYSYEEAFVEFLKINSCDSKDMVVTISSSGNSPNVVNVLKYCRDNEISTVGFSGLKPNNLTVQLAKYSLYVPVKTYGMAECIHQIFLHLWLDRYMDIYEWDREEFQNMNADEFKL